MRTFTSSAVILLGGCARRDLPPDDRPWLLDRLRILAIAAEPAEPRPGDAVSFEPLIYVPGDVALDSVAWSICPPGPYFDADCAAETLPGPDWIIPADALDFLSDLVVLDEEARAQGVEALVFLDAPPGGAADHRAEDAAFKYLRVSESPTPNNNPLFLGFTVDGEPLDPGETLLAEPGQVYAIDPVLDPASVETYLTPNYDGTYTEEEEYLYVEWFSDAGSFYLAYGTYPEASSNLWTAPRQPFEGLLIAIARDYRLGMAWGVLPFRVE